MLTLIEGGRVYAPEPCGVRPVLLADGHVGKVGEIDRGALERLGAEYEVIDARGCIVAPALIDPHVHLLGGSGETGFSTQTPEFFISELVQNGITTVVGTLGVDTTMKTMAGLLAKVKALKEHGLNAFCWTGGYDLPPASILGSVREDILFIDEVIGAGEIAISDTRALPPRAARAGARGRARARRRDAGAQGGAGARARGRDGLAAGTPVVRVLDDFDVEADWFYPTHVERSEKLMGEAIHLAQKGGMPWTWTWWSATCTAGSLLARPRRPAAPAHRSSDASITAPPLMEQLRDCVLNHGFALEQVLPLATRNTARILKLREKGELRKGCAGDILLLEEGSLEIVHVLSHGRFVVRDGQVVEREAWLEDSDRRIRLEGEKAGERRGGRGLADAGRPAAWAEPPYGYPTGGTMADADEAGAAGGGAGGAERAPGARRAPAGDRRGGGPGRGRHAHPPPPGGDGGRQKARIIICSSPSENPEEKVDTYGELFEKIGVAEVIPAPITDRKRGGRRRSCWRR